MNTMSNLAYLYLGITSISPLLSGMYKEIEGDLSG